MAGKPAADPLLVTIHRDEAMAECLAAKQPLANIARFAGGGRGADAGQLVPTALCQRGGMIRLSTLLLAPPVGERLSERYDDYRQHGASVLAFLGCLWASLAGIHAA